MGMNTADRKPVVVCGPSRTKQSFRKACDINTLVEKYKSTGVFASQNRRQPFYGDVSGMKDYRESLDVVIRAREAFDSLPVRVRERFDYDPGKMVAFFEDPANLEEAISKGWAVRKPVAPKDGPGGPVAPTGGPGGPVTPVGVVEPSGGTGEPAKAS